MFLLARLCRKWVQPAGVRADGIDRTPIIPQHTAYTAVVDCPQHEYMKAGGKLLQLSHIPKNVIGRIGAAVFLFIPNNAVSIQRLQHDTVPYIFAAGAASAALECDRLTIRDRHSVSKKLHLHSLLLIIFVRNGCGLTEKIQSVLRRDGLFNRKW